MKPYVSRHHGNVQLRIYDARVYPRKSANGSIVIVYAHEEGVRVVWYGGKPFKPSQSNTAKNKINGTKKDEPMVIDLDHDDEPPARDGIATEAEFEEEDDEVDAAHPYQNVRRFLDIPLGNAAIQLAVPSLPLESENNTSQEQPPIFYSKIVIAVSCGDLTIRILSIPLLPPSPEVSSLAAIGMQEIVIQAANSHQELLSGLALSYTGPGNDADEVAVIKETAVEREEDLREWSLLLASVSSSGHGLLLVHQIPISDKVISTELEHRIPIQRQRLRLTTLDAKLKFNNGSYPAPRHSSLSLTLPEQGCVMIYQIFNHTSTTGARRGSTTTISSASSNRPSRGNDSQVGKFLLSLRTAFSTEQTGENATKRREILDSAWINGGRALMVLLEDGEWGIWQIEPSTSTQQNGNFARDQSNTATLHGGSVSRFAFRGSVSADTSKNKTTKTNQPAQDSALAPMTPHTRKMRSEGLFQGSGRTQLVPEEVNLQARGRITVSKCIARRLKFSSSYDEALILSYMNVNHHVPSVQSMLRTESSNGGSIESSFSSRFNTLQSVQLSGGEATNAELLPQVPTQSETGLFGATQSQPGFLVSTAYSIILSIPPFSASTDTDGTFEVSNPLTSRALPARSRNSEQVLLSHGELDIDGMDRMLNNMANRGGPANALATLGASTNNFSKSVNFQIDEDDGDLSTMDVDMASPTPARNLKRAGGTPRLASGRKLFT